jgi:hypothetical protein
LRSTWEVERAHPKTVKMQLTMPGAFAQPRPHPLAPAANITCPSAPSVNCSAPACPSAGATVQLAGTCRPSDPAASLIYTVSGQAAQSTTCPAANLSLVVGVQPTYLGLPACVYVSKTAYTLTCAGELWRVGGG